MANSQTSAKKIASLARIELTDAEAERVQSEFDSILDYIHQIDTVEIPDSGGGAAQGGVVSGDGAHDLHGQDLAGGGLLFQGRAAPGAEFVAICARQSNLPEGARTLASPARTGLPSMVQVVFSRTRRLA